MIVKYFIDKTDSSIPHFKEGKYQDKMVKKLRKVKWFHTKIGSRPAAERG